MRPTADELRECLLDMLRATPEHAWATPSLTAAFAWREQARVTMQLRRLVAPLGLAGCSGWGTSPLWWWALDTLAAQHCAACGGQATTWAHGLVAHAWRDEPEADERAWIPGTGGWCCGAASCSAVILTRQWQAMAERARAAGPSARA